MRKTRHSRYMIYIIYIYICIEFRTSRRECDSRHKVIIRWVLAHADSRMQGKSWLLLQRVVLFGADGKKTRVVSCTSALFFFFSKKQQNRTRSDTRRCSRPRRGFVEVFSLVTREKEYLHHRS